jgi:hypothetical protein
VAQATGTPVATARMIATGEERAEGLRIEISHGHG